MSPPADTDDTSRTPPLAAVDLAVADILTERHHSDDAKADGALRFDLGSGCEPPEIRTRLVRAGCAAGTTHWQLEVSAADRGLRAAEPRAVEPVRVHRSVLARERVHALPASMPLGDQRLALRPQLRALPGPYMIRFGELRYAPTTIFSPDGRRAYYDEAYPWRCLVRVTTPRGWSGSGVLIGPRHVVTASHCVDWTPGWLRVDVMYSNTRSLGSAHGVFAYAESQVGPGSIPDDESDEDYAVIVLDQPLGSRFGWLGCRTYDSGWDDETSAWHSIGYPQDWSGSGEIAAWQTGFQLNELGADYGSARLIRSRTFDNWKGQSGSPVFGFWPKGPYVVGVVSGEGPDYNYISGGSLLPSLVGRARNQHP